jgi:hypothetical protein
MLWVYKFFMLFKYKFSTNSKKAPLTVRLAGPQSID